MVWLWGNTAHCAKLSCEDLSRYSNKISWFKKTRTPTVEAHRPINYLQFPIQVCFSILSVCPPRPASHAHFRHQHPYGLNSSIDVRIIIILLRNDVTITSSSQSVPHIMAGIDTV